MKRLLKFPSLGNQRRKRLSRGSRSDPEELKPPSRARSHKPSAPLSHPHKPTPRALLWASSLQKGKRPGLPQSQGMTQAPRLRDPSVKEVRAGCKRVPRARRLRCFSHRLKGAATAAAGREEALWPAWKASKGAWAAARTKKTGTGDKQRNPQLQRSAICGFCYREKGRVQLGWRRAEKVRCKTWLEFWKTRLLCSREKMGMHFPAFSSAGLSTLTNHMEFILQLLVLLFWDVIKGELQGSLK